MACDADAARNALLVGAVDRATDMRKLGRTRRRLDIYCGLLLATRSLDSYFGPTCITFNRLTVYPDEVMGRLVIARFAPLATPAPRSTQFCLAHSATLSAIFHLLTLFDFSYRLGRIQIFCLQCQMRNPLAYHSSAQSVLNIVQCSADQRLKVSFCPKSSEFTCNLIT